MAKLGITEGTLNDCPNSPNCVSSSAKNNSHAIQAIEIKASNEEVRARLLTLIGKMTRSKIVIADDDYIHAEFTSLIFRFVDDVEFYFPASDDEITTIQVRSASRIGRSDFGVNRKRVEEFRTLLS